jgi:hypothetical protein
LKEVFPELFRIAINKEAWVRDHMQLSNGVKRGMFLFYERCVITGHNHVDPQPVLPPLETHGSTTKKNIQLNLNPN